MMSKLREVRVCFLAIFFLNFSPLLVADETLPPLKDDKSPQTFEEMWAGFDPRKEPLDVEVLKEWEEVCWAQEKVAGDTPNCTIVRTDDLNTGASPPHWKTKTVTQRVDDLHMSADGYKILGSRFAEESIKLLQKVVPQ